MDKARLRSKLIQKRKEIPLGEAEARNKLIEEQVRRLVDWRSVSAVHAYTAHRSLREVDTSWLKRYIEKNWPHISVTFGEPSKSAEIPKQEFDLIFVPLVAFDDNKHRLGFGGGWYDRFLAGQLKAQKIGLAYDMQQADSLPVAEHDIKLDYIVTESRVI